MQIRKTCVPGTTGPKIYCECSFLTGFLLGDDVHERLRFRPGCLCLLRSVEGRSVIHAYRFDEPLGSVFGILGVHSNIGTVGDPMSSRCTVRGPGVVGPRLLYLPIELRLWDQSAERWGQPRTSLRIFSAAYKIKDRGRLVAS